MYFTVSFKIVLIRPPSLKEYSSNSHMEDEQNKHGALSMRVFYL